ncbi:hypothetical protein [Aeoliella mucimassa]|uniref:Uncharacterized protein n=1 Tax=Aeoliella mucimassa TaxID=2527972 RepID=A0A518APX3_9BACT|nr:hypothetical protein [Aeoliella mucimassa]QDU56771.1 hypothetical protein Pan181_29830 [Aeoliella mucimassa]
MQSRSAAGWLCRVYPHNPLYLVSAALVLYGIHHASSDGGLQVSSLKTSLLFAYVLMLAASGWLVVRFGRMWEDARTILLVVLLMFMAISTSYDLLCLNNPTSGGQWLLVAFVFCAVVVEGVLAGLRIRLPLIYRGPFYVQLALLFAFPAVLGRLSIDGHEDQMCVGVLAFSGASAVSLLLLLPAIRCKTLADNRHGTPWLWPYYPWSIFVMMGLALAVRLWMLSVSFTDARGLSPAFHPYFLVPVLLAIAVLLLEFGLVHRRIGLQRAALLMLPCIALLSFPTQVSPAQALSLRHLQHALAAPPLLTAICIAAIALVAMLRRASGARILAMASLLFLACLDAETLTFHQLHVPQWWFLMLVFVALIAFGLWKANSLLLSAAGALALVLLATSFEQRWVSEQQGWRGVVLWSAWSLMLPLVCRDLFAKLLRLIGPILLALAGSVVVLDPPPPWVASLSHTVEWLLAGMLVLGIAYLMVTRIRWQLLPIGWLALLLLACASRGMLLEIENEKLRQGLVWYAGGCAVLLAAVMLSFWKAGLGSKIVAWLVHEPATPDP